MLLPQLIVIVLAGVIANVMADVLPYVADGIATLCVMGWCYCPVADVIATLVGMWADVIWPDGMSHWVKLF